MNPIHHGHSEGRITIRSLVRHQTILCGIDGIFQLLLRTLKLELVRSNSQIDITGRTLRPAMTHEGIIYGAR